MTGPPVAKGNYTKDWQRACAARGGVPSVDPVSGADACRFPDVVTDAAPWRYEPANKSLTDLLDTWFGASEDDAGRLGEKIDEWKGAIVAGRDDVKTAVGLDDGVTGLAGKLLGVPHWAVVVLAILALYMLGVGAGLIPPIRALWK